MTTPRRDPPLKHDDSEIDSRTILRFAFGLLGVTVAIVAIAWTLTQTLDEEEHAHQTPPPPIATSMPTTPIEPRLQPSPPLGLEALRAEEKKVLEEYRWVDKGNGVVSIPIERAIDIVAERGLPHRGEPFPATTVTQPTQSTLGETPKEAEP